MQRYMSRLELHDAAVYVWFLGQIYECEPIGHVYTRVQLNPLYRSERIGFYVEFHTFFGPTLW